MAGRLTEIIVGILLLVGTIVLIVLALMRGYFSVETLLEYCLNIAPLIGAVLLFNDGSIKQTIYWRVISFCFGILTIGVLFKILHWKGADMLLLMSSFAIAITYFTRYLSKKQKNHFDLLKMLWICSVFICVPLFIIHLISRDYSIITTALFWLTFIDFCVLKILNKKTRPL